MSRNVLFYFTGTGNSLAVAKAVAVGLTNAVLVPIVRDDALDYIGKDTDSVGLIYPVHINAIPNVVERFITKMALGSSVYLYAIATHGGVPGMSGLYLNRVFRRKNLDLDAYFEVKMVNNTPKGVAPKFLMNLNWEADITPDRVAMVLSEAQLATASIISALINKEETTRQHLPTGGKRVTYWIMSLVWDMTVKSKHKLRFLVDESCTACGVCEKTCTTERIRMHGNRPEWIHENCSFCYACFNYCPEQAIGVKHYTKKLGRYHHPAIASAEIASRAVGSLPD